MLLQAVTDQQPDLIAVSGDLADERTAKETLPALLTGLAEIAPTYYVTGNHEWVREDTEDLLGKSPAAASPCCATTTCCWSGTGRPSSWPGRRTQCLPGYGDAEALVARIRAEVPGDPYILMLYHRK